MNRPDNRPERDRAPHSNFNKFSNPGSGPRPGGPRGPRPDSRGDARGPQGGGGRPYEPRPDRPWNGPKPEGRGGYGDRPARPSFDRGEGRGPQGGGGRPYEPRPDRPWNGPRPEGRGGYGDRPERPSFDRGEGRGPQGGGGRPYEPRPDRPWNGPRPEGRGGYGDRPERPSFDRGAGRGPQGGGRPSEARGERPWNMSRREDRRRSDDRAPSQPGRREGSPVEQAKPVDSEFAVDTDGPTMTKTEIKKRKKVAKMLAAGQPIPEDLQRFLLPPGAAFDGESEDAGGAEMATEEAAEVSDAIEPQPEADLVPEVVTEFVDESIEAVASSATVMDDAAVSVPEESDPVEAVAQAPEAPVKKVRKTKKQLAEEAAAAEALAVAQAEAQAAAEAQAEADALAAAEAEARAAAEAEAQASAEAEALARASAEAEARAQADAEAQALAAAEAVAQSEAPAAEEPATEPSAKDKKRKGRVIIDVEVPEDNPVPAIEQPVLEVSAETPGGKSKKKAKKTAEVPTPTTDDSGAKESDGPLFADLGLPDSLLKAVSAAGFESPTPIQARSIPPLLAGHDLVGQAQTGTGKTAAFALPILAGIDPSSPGTQALVVVPTRELAIQAAEQFVRFGNGIRVVPVYGGQPIDRQFRALMKPPAVVVGTPGRLLDHLRRGSLNLGTVRFCALDEADEMLSFGFIDDIEAILAELPEIRQTALFSATMPPRIAALADKYLKKPVRIEIEAKQRTVETVRQFVYEVPPGRKREALARILDMEIPGPTIVFCRTRAETQDLADTLRLRGYDAEPLHGDMAQAERDRIMKKFRDEQTDLLVATDVAARGLDISGVTHVVNFDLPWDVEQYIHRIGRTGRAGREGDAISIIEPKERRNLRRFEFQLGLRLEQRRLPSSADIAARRREVFSSKVRERLEEGGFDDQLEAVSELSESWDVADIAAAALHLLWEASGIAKSESVDDELAAEGERPEPGMARLFVSIGRMDRVRPNELVQVIRQETGLGPGAIGTIDIMDRCSFIEVPQEHAERVIQVLGSVPYRGRKPKCGYAKPKENEGPGRRF